MSDAPISRDQFPTWQPDDMLSRWSALRLEIRCARASCGASVDSPIALIVKRHGDMRFADYLRRVRCRNCRGLCGPIYLNTDSYRRYCGRPASAWSFEIVRGP